MKGLKDKDTLPYSGSQAALRRRSVAKTEFTLRHSETNIGTSNEPVNGRLEVGASLLDALYKHIEPTQFAAMPISPEAKLNFAKDATTRKHTGPMFQFSAGVMWTVYRRGLSHFFRHQT